jgi:RimJ/RimL family protein N-acetyltransferase
MNVEPVVLEGEHVRLEPMRVDHLPALCRVGMDESLWEWTINNVREPADLEKYVRSALSDQMLAKAVPFVTVERSSGTIVGSTRFGNIDLPNRKAEIGWTWINPRWQRTVINTEAKFLMLKHAFETWKCVRVEFKTDSFNKKSRKALGRIGAFKEGILRNHMITDSGRFRHSVYFSILESEWESVKTDLSAKLVRNS